MTQGMGEGPAHSGESVFAEIETAKQHVEEGGEGNWLVSYADMMTLLVGFFVILLSFSKVDEEKFEAIKKIASQEFGGVYRAPFSDLSEEIKKELDKLGLGDAYVIKQTEGAVQISFRGNVFFDTGSVELREQGKELLDKIIPVIQGQGKTFEVYIQGYTDDVPIGHSFQYKTNWELSSIRACRVLDVFERNGFTKEHLTAIGYGESRPLVQNRDSTGNPIPKNRDLNRRVLIRLMKSSSKMVGGADKIPVSPGE